MPNAANGRRTGAGRGAGAQGMLRPSNSDARPAALRGAALAFGARTERPSTPTASKPENDDNGALKAAVIAGRSQSPAPAQHEENDSPSISSVKDRIKLFSAEETGSTPSQNPRSRTDAQHVAAQLAVDRSAGQGSTKRSNVPSGGIIQQSLGMGNTTGSCGPHTPVRGKPQQEERTSVSCTGTHSDLSEEQEPCNGSTASGNMQQLQPPTPRSGHYYHKPSQSLEHDNTGIKAQGREKRVPPPRTMPSTPSTRSQNSTGPNPASNSDAHAIAGVAARSTPHLSLPQTHANALDHSAPRPSKTSMADARVASSLASSWAASPSKENSTPPPPAYRLARSRSSLHPVSTGRSESSRTPSPSKGLKKTTLREESKSDNESRRHHGKRRIKRPHPHKYSEGSRKRWRDSITEAERKRYEGVWAANKGILLRPDSFLQDMVVNVVVREIWSRSRLPLIVLEQIWDLVSHDAEAMVLSREEFVVGMWLIDQCLKGRKLSWKVSQSVWDSVRRAPGIEVPGFRS